MAHVLPATDREFVEERNAVAGFYSRKESAVGRRQRLVSATARARVRDGVAALILYVRVAGVDATEVRQQRDEAATLLIDAVLNAVRAIDLCPGENGALDLCSSFDLFGMFFP